MIGEPILERAIVCIREIDAMNKQQFYDEAGKAAKSAVVFCGDGITAILKHPSEHGSLVVGYLLIGMVTFLVLALAGHRSTKAGPAISAAIMLAWPIPWAGVFLHGLWTAIAYFFWQMWRGD